MYTIRPFNPTTNEDYQALLAVHNAAWPDEPASMASWRFNDTHWQKGKLRQRFVVENDGQLIAEGNYLEPFWARAPGKYYYGYSILPAYEERSDLHQAVYDHVLAQLAERQPTALGIDTREDKTFRMNWLQSQGFAAKMRYPVSELDVTTFDFSRFEGAQERVAGAGVTILPLAELREKDANWLRKTYEMLWQIEQDVPQVDPPVKEPFEEFVKGLKHPNFWPEAWFIAVDPAASSDDDPVGAYVGVSMLGKNPPMPERLYTWLTGVVRSHRRKGIALAMKLRAIELAQQSGAIAIRTDNEENNPMLGINKTLGFVEIPAGVEYEKEL